MTDGAARERSMLSGECVYGTEGQQRSRNGGGVLNWTELLKVENGGPGESPGRERAIAEAREVTAARYAAGGFKKARGSSKAKPVKTVSRQQVRKAGW